MTTRSKRKGSAFEADCVPYAKQWWPWIERRVLNGNKDKGDLTHPTVVFECKNNPRENISPAAMLREVDVEMANAGCDVGFVWRRTPGKTDPGEGICIIRPAVLFDLLKKAGY